MFKETEKNDGIETIIGPSVRVEGDFSANGNVVVEGIVAGTIKTEKNLRIGPEAKIFASVSAANAQIAGEIQGNVRINEKLELKETAKIFGDIKTSVLIVSPGASIDGKCHCGDDKKSRLEKPEPVKKEPAADFMKAKGIKV
ncbi:polymer-forming cytoskeletal protein [Candidatus Parcubacteria bacterium]|nr:MAG: polymer-forming cytoskeletal protein [Candidatus Parcubacteria bacterium]